jgi:hypothetical protein
MAIIASPGSVFSYAIANEASPDRSAFILLSDPQRGEDGFLYPIENRPAPIEC